MYVDIYTQIKERITMTDITERYGFEVKRGVMLCPFHNDSNPSINVYPGSHGWYCWVCNEGGSVIDFVAKLFQINIRQAALRIDNDFRLGLSDAKPDRRAVNAWMEKRRREQAALKAYRAEYDAKCREAYQIRTMPKPPSDSPLMGEYAALLGRLDYLDNYYFEEHHWR